MAVLLAAAALLAREPRQRALAMLGALLLAPVLLLADIWDSPQLAVVRDHPLPAAAGGVVAIGVGRRARVAMARHALVLPLLVLAALPFRVPIEVGGTTSNLLVPLYVVIAAGALAAIARGLREDARRRRRRRWSPGWLSRAAGAVGRAVRDPGDLLGRLRQGAAADRVLHRAVRAAVRAARAGRVDERLLRLCLGLLVGLALVFSAIGCVEYATKHIFLNPKLLASNDLHTYFRTNSVFFDPNIYGRFLVVAMLAVAATMLQAARVADGVDRRRGRWRRCGPGSC